ncbi:MAG: IclR family transcriptional regulator [Planctomycetes bacterium]|nr:IclR family transcriptional regulator [Planctomycetota bacterium]
MLNIKANGNGLVQSVVRALDILKVLGRSERGLGVTELAKAVDLKVPTAHNLLRTLVAKGYVAKDATSQRYRLGFNCASLGRAYRRTLRVPEIARPHIEELAQRLNESVIVAMIEGGEILFVARAAGNQMLTVNFERSLVRTGFTSVCGRVLLAHLPDHMLERYLAVHPIEDAKSEDVHSREDLDRILAQARRDGYLEYWRENNTVLAIAAPIRDFTGEVVASVGLGMPGVRFKKSEHDVVVGAVKETANKISTDLGYVEPEIPVSEQKEESNV